MSASTGKPRNEGVTLTDAAVRTWPTPAARDWRDGRASPETMDRNARPLNEVAVKWATPQAHDAIPGNAARVGRYGTKHGGRNLNDDAAAFSPSGPPAPTPGSGKGSRPRLNPRFVEWLMGLPEGWSDPGSPLSATALRRFKLRMRSELLRLAP